MVREKFAVRLSPEERGQLEHLVRAGRSSARIVARARILLKTDAGWPAPKVVQALDVAESSVYRIKRRFAEDGAGGCAPRPASDPPVPQARRPGRGPSHRPGLHSGSRGYDHWTLRALAGRMVELGVVESLSHETVRLHLKKHPHTVAEAAVVHSRGER